MGVHLRRQRLHLRPALLPLALLHIINKAAELIEHPVEPGAYLSHLILKPAFEADG
ncbi:hypothetical protein D3C75_1338090 [compost metagenome]